MDFNLLHTVLGRYCTVRSIDATPESYSIDAIGGSFQVFTGRQIDLTLSFYDSDALSKFAEVFVNNEKEEELRRNNPTLQRAYNDYKTLLNLIK